MSEASRVLKRLCEGDSPAAEELLPLVYDELRKLAAHKLRTHPQGTLQPTALVHEAWMRLTGGGNARYENQGHFFSAAAEAMRRILIDRARQRQALKRGGNLERVDLDGAEVALPADDETLLAMNDALDSLAQHDPDAAGFIQLRFYAGLTNEEAALALGVPERTARRHWSFAKAWLYREMQRRARE